MNATLKVTLCNSKETIDERRVQVLFEHYGEIRRVIRVPGVQAYATIRHLEFFDTRDCIKAQKELHGHELQGGTIEVEFVEQKETADTMRGEEESRRVKLKGTKRSYDQANEDTSSGPFWSDTEDSTLEHYPQSSQSSNDDGSNTISERLAEAQKLQRLLSALKPRNPVAPPALASQPAPAPAPALSPAQVPAQVPAPTPTPTPTIITQPEPSSSFQPQNVYIAPPTQPITRDPRLRRHQTPVVPSRQSHPATSPTANTVDPRRKNSNQWVDLFNF
ncbi:hypothetical protein VNI00_010589 [Paramarasmius palmivorus]|uniref:RRM domain-containing protein n=1 Tax=Paramarasmius palmivorus TaxID=297713 RepID=A0AAW0CID0_9AGAR